MDLVQLCLDQGGSDTVSPGSGSDLDRIEIQLQNSGSGVDLVPNPFIWIGSNLDPKKMEQSTSLVLHNMPGP